MDPLTSARMKAVALTHVRYDDGDWLGHLLAWASLLPVFISLGGFFTHFLFRRELQAIFFALGLLLSEIINEYVKDAVNEARPLTCQALEMCDTLGWPSSHSQYMCFFSIYLTLLAAHSFTFSSTPGKLFAMILPWPFAALVMYSRVYLGYHSVSQVFAGGAFGLFLGTLWYVLVNGFFVHFFPMMEDLPVCRFFYVRDSTHIPNIMEFEYNNCREARKLRESQINSIAKVAKD